MNILSLNAGSSSLKYGLYRFQEASADRSEETVMARGIVELPPDPDGLPSADEAKLESADASLLRRIEEGQLTEGNPVTISAVGCRVVHGGPDFTEATRVTPSVVAAIRQLAKWAPLHNPIDAAMIESTSRSLPQVPVVAVFDTAFHHTLPDVASAYALPQDVVHKHGLRRYGFHGISHRYVSERLRACLGDSDGGNEAATETRLVTCHLGNGASVCAVRNGRSIDTSMGLTPLEGLVMGTRSGDLDPGLLLYLMGPGGLSAAELDDLLNHRSGLLGLSGSTADVRKLEKAASQGDALAERALEVFAYRVGKYIGAYAAALEGLDAVAFTGGIGEHSPAMRQRICRRLHFLGLELDPEKNEQARGEAESRIDQPGSGRKAETWVIPVDEELQIARETWLCLGKA